MVFHIADIQTATNSWASHRPLTDVETDMKASFKACEDTANSLRNTLESLEVIPNRSTPARDSEDIACGLHDALREDGNEDNLVVYRSK